MRLYYQQNNRKEKKEEEASSRRNQRQRKAAKGRKTSRGKAGQPRAMRDQLRRGPALKGNRQPSNGNSHKGTAESSEQGSHTSLCKVSV